MVKWNTTNPMNKLKVYVLSTLLTFSLAIAPSAFQTADAASKKAKSYSSKSYKKSRKFKRKRGGVGCQALSRSTLNSKASRFQKSISSASKRYGVSRDLIKAVITVESCFKKRARGTSGEKGLMQLMPATARRFGVKKGYNPWQNIHGGTKYLSYLLKRYNGNTRRAVAAYNAGEGNVGRTGRIRNKAYVRKVMRAYSKLSKGKKQRIFQPSKAYSPKRSKALAKKSVKAKTSTVKTSRSKQSFYTVKKGDTLFEVMRQTGTHVKELKKLNQIQAPYTIKVGQKIRFK